MFVTLPDGKRLELPAGATARDVAQAIGPGLAKAALGATVGGQLTDLLSELPDGAEVAILTKKDEAVVRLMRHTLAHVMAQAVRDLFVAEGYAPERIKMGVGPVIDNGFYYDFDLPRTLTPDDLERIEARMREIIRAKLPLRRFALPRAEALARFEGRDPYKLELIQNLPEDVPITFYEQGGADGFTDLCRGPHVPNTGDLPQHFKLMSVAGAYWRGDETRPMLQRVYGVAFRTKEELEDHLWRLEEAKKRDHRKLGAELEIFTLDDDIGPGLPLWLPRGAVIVEEIEKLAKEMERRAGYQQVRTPHVTKEQLFTRSGHLPYYAESMFPPMELDNVRYYLKPMNCPFHHKIFAARPRSYRELPLRLAEYGTCYRYEDHGALMGLMRVRSMQMNDAHIYCTPEQFEDEFMGVIALYLEYFRLFGIRDYVMRLSKHSRAGLGKKYVNNPELWEQTEAMVRGALERGGINFIEVEDEAAFYGPKIDVQIYSVIGREFTLATNQVDFAVPARFGLEYVAEDGSRKTPLCLHRAPLSTHERLVGFLLEHFAGDFPLWLAPEQVRVVPIADRHNAYAQSLKARLAEAGLRAEADLRGERMNAKVRDAELLKVPYTVIVGDKEVEAGALSFRSRKEPEQKGVSVEAFVAHLQAHVGARALEVTPLAAPVAARA
ncbi:threonine--tRNA ligase [Truepera radiovictrix]|uniref:Threonine--tRNA ligase n=1 Tax=Truepera radiovictrix (strain DSM 17093 / CIP 108686 / LMG 22925 / RQ-24) TaxID=649638 RepID=D7CYB8_TRURR|nr:threonine--tRNA ligase [Truepera radiovictrix]ADI14757.1 threonyl-tRNA synthetase [Truepera radiovictrix DSM 17093]WMT56693.1 threonine--tRNA ligase [Truepera radiovictrix]